MNFDYSKSAASATRLLRKYGRPIVIGSQTSGAPYNVATGTFQRTPITQQSVGVLLEYSSREKGELLAAGTVITDTTRKLLMSVDGIVYEPKIGDMLAWITDASITDWWQYLTTVAEKYSVMQVAKLSPAGVTVIYELMVKR